jgi:hypothetical protein
MDFILAVASLLDIAVGYSIYMNDKLAAHPAYLVGLIALADGFYNYLGVTRHNLCGPE